MRRTPIALHRAAEDGDSEMVAQLLATNPNDTSEEDGSTALHYAARGGHCKVVAQLLAAIPELIGAKDCDGTTPLFSAAAAGHEAVVAQLLAVDPSLIHGESDGRTLLHEAGSVGVVDLLLATKPALIDAVDIYGDTPLHSAVQYSFRLVVQRLLEVKPELASVVNEAGDTPLHEAVLGFERSQELGPLGSSRVPRVSIVWMLAEANPQALRVANNKGHTPLHSAVVLQNRDLIWELLRQGVFLFDEVVSAFTDCNKSYQELLRPTVETQCECLLTLLTRDVTGTVFEYLGFDRAPQQHKRAKLA